MTAKKAHGVPKGFASKIGGAMAGAASATYAAVPVIHAVGFETAGVLIESPAAMLMTWHGLVLAGSTCTTLQSIGATGALGVGATVVVTAAGAYVGVKVVSSLVGKDKTKKDETKENEIEKKEN
ncbi:hypothetical protein PCASD_00424 [Puccinia coronata f. sp. avenae]|uniref:Uncharacterized protein n=1 Tax=Puccinia coronata f. sp. avenae TaxID=200324 RepID=A0A2N5SHH4_9BASI|nr:hypothetical protein PCASD_21621 [Puccinia coronata f. sp. avenae]PLW51504.1 hypothetical protein PCASD_00424 [Puccinia coronata f. sp. avenae]